MAVLTYDCAEREGILPAGFSEEQFVATYHREQPWDVRIEIFSDGMVGCMDDPLDVRHSDSDIPYPADPLQVLPNPAWDADIEAARANTTSPLQRRILEDHQITDVEVDLANQAFLQCMAEAGYDVTLDPDPFIPGSHRYSYSLPDGAPMSSSVAGRDPLADYDEQFGECGRTWNMDVVATRDAMVVNPDNLPIFDLNLDCLHQHDLVPEEFGMSEIEHAAETGDWGPGVDPSTAMFTMCLVNPLEVGTDPHP